MFSLNIKKICQSSFHRSSNFSFYSSMKYQSLIFVLKLVCIPSIISIYQIFTSITAFVYFQFSADMKIKTAPEQTNKPNRQVCRKLEIMRQHQWPPVHQYCNCQFAMRKTYPSLIYGITANCQVQNISTSGGMILPAARG